jgi:hypothetical protein
MSLTQFETAERSRERVVRPVTPTPVELIVRCLAERKDNYWQAFSLEFGLAVQGESLPDVKRRLESMILSYVSDALNGEDREHAYELLTRKATLNVYAKYYFADLLSRAERIWGASNNTVLFSEPLPLAPVCTLH